MNQIWYRQGSDDVPAGVQQGTVKGSTGAETRSAGRRSGIRSQRRRRGWREAKSERVQLFKATGGSEAVAPGRARTLVACATL